MIDLEGVKVRCGHIPPAHLGRIAARHGFRLCAAAAASSTPKVSVWYRSAKHPDTVRGEILLKYLIYLGNKWWMRQGLNL